jgi:small-conductance mechanosensitive channel
MSYTLFHFGPYNVCLWNLIALFFIFISAFVLRRIIHRSLRRYLLVANIKLEGNKATWLRILSQSVYLIAIYVAVLSFKINNNNVSFIDFLSYNLFESKKFTLSFYQIILLIVVFFGAKILINFIKLYYFQKFRNKKDYNPSKEYVYIQISKYIVYIFAIIFSLKTLNIDLTLLLTGSAALLVGLGLGLQDVFKDFFSGLILLFEGGTKIGDVIELQDSKFKEPIIAKIIKINARTTQIETRDGNILIIPNAKLTQEYVENWSHGTNLTRFTISLRVSYNSDTELVSNLLKQAALSHPKVKKTKPVLIRLKDFGESGLEIDLLFWADQSWEIEIYKSEIRFEIYRLFKQYKIKIPFPQRDVNIDSDKKDDFL